MSTLPGDLWYVVSTRIDDILWVAGVVIWDIFQYLIWWLVIYLDWWYIVSI